MPQRYPRALRWFAIGVTPLGRRRASGSSGLGWTGPTRTALLLGLLAWGCGSADADTTTLGVSGRANANVSLAAVGDVVAAVWSAAEQGGPTDIYLSISHDGGASFPPPTRVNDTPGDARVNGEQPPRVALVPRAQGPPEVVVIWTAKGPDGTTLRTSRSGDGGKSFVRAAVVPGTDGPGNRGWEAIVVDRTGTVHAVWLDHRRLSQRTSSAETTHRHAHSTADGAPMSDFSDLYFATLDGDPPSPLTAGVCYCCKTAIAAAAGGDVYLAWRHVYPGNFRDIAFAVTTPGQASPIEPVRVSEDRWMLQGCPDDGPAMAVDRRGTVHIVWPTVVTEGDVTRKVLFLASSTDGRSFTARTPLPVEGQAHHPQLAVAHDGTLAIAWDEVFDGRRRIVTARGRPGENGRLHVERDARVVDDGVYPAMAVTTTAAVVAWTAGQPDRSTIQLRRSLLVQ